MANENEKPRFDINPHVIKQLGYELVSDSVTALMELIKNSYDADADYVKVTINTNESLNDGTLFFPGQIGYILIEDDGMGMNEDVIKKSWLVISYSNKRAVNGVKPKTPKGRTPLGDKGLGRLSTQRLANICEIYTKAINDDFVHAGFDWQSFDEVAKLSDVDVKTDHSPFNISKEKNQGTKLILMGLVDRGVWSGDNLERFKAQICQLISPYQENKPFKVYLSINGESIDVEGEYKKLDKVCVSDISFSYNNMLVTIELNIQLLKLRSNTDNLEQYDRYIASDNGEKFLKYFLDKKKSSSFRRGENGSYLHFSDTIDVNIFIKPTLFDQEILIPDPGPFTGRIREFSFINDYQSWVNLYESFDAYKSFVKNQIGIKLYRNGFAIKPYGIDGNDWLELSKGQTSGSSFYGLRPGNVIGYIAIDEEKNKNLKDKTDREGLIKNAYYRLFLNINYEIIKRVNEAIEILKRSYKEYIKQFDEDGKKRRIKTYPGAVKQIEETAQKSSKLMPDIKEAEREISDVRQKIKSVTNGDMSLFENETQKKEDALLQTSEVLTRYSDLLQKVLEVMEAAPELKRAIEVITPMVEKMQGQLEDFTSLASLGLVSEMLSHEMGEIIDRLFNESRKLSKKIQDNLIVDKEDVLNLIEYIKTTVTSVRAQLKHLDASFKYNKVKIESVQISELIEEDEHKFYRKKLDNLGLDFQLNVNNNFEVIINRGKLIQVFDNLMNNSIYWLIQCKERENINGLCIKVTVDKPYVYFEDNGWGVEKNVEDSIFEPFVTRKPAGEGRGLGLYIVKNLLNADNCDIALTDDRNQKAQRYKFVLNFANIIK